MYHGIGGGDAVMSQLEIVPGKTPTVAPTTNSPGFSSSSTVFTSSVIIAMLLGIIVVIFGILNFFAAVWMWRRRKTSSSSFTSEGDRQPLITNK
jgi:hypothetical protein